MNTAVTMLLQLAASLLLTAQHGQLPRAVQEQMVAIAAQSIQISAQAAAKIDFPVPQNNSIYPNVGDLANSPYIGPDGGYVKQGTSVQVLDQYLSFGDLNGDGFDDAAVIVKRTDANGNASFALAALLNQGNILFNIADFPLGNTMPQIYAHDIQNGTIVLNMQIGSQPRATSTYELFGNTLPQVNL